MNKYQAVGRYFLALITACVTYNAQADIIDLTSHTALKGAYVIEQPSAPEVTVALFIEAGEFDNVGPEGLPHYLEHLVFWSADKSHGSGPKDRSANAWTSRDWTGYWNSGVVEKTSDMLDNAVNVFAEIDLHAAFANSERDIVEREYDLRMSESATYQLYEKLHELMYKGHPFSRSVIGNRDSIAQFTPNIAKQFKDNWYLANNATLLVSGPIKASEVKSLLKAKFNNLPVGEIPAHTWKESIVSPTSVDVEMKHRNLSVPKLLYLKHAPSLDSLSRTQQFIAAELLMELLNSSLPGSIAKPLYYDDFLTLSVGAYSYVQPDGSLMLVVEAEPSDDTTADQLFSAMDRAVSDLISEPGFESSFDQIKEKKLKTLKRRRAESSMQLDLAMTSLVQVGRPLTAEQIIEEYQSLSAKQAYALLEALAKSDTVARGSVYPEK